MGERVPSFNGAWRDLSRTPGWVKPVCVVALCGWIPLVGSIALFGYGLEWARRIAWGSEEGPKQHRFNWSRLIATGVRAYAVSFTLQLLLGLVLSLLDVMPLRLVVRTAFFAANPLSYALSGPRHLFGDGLVTMLLSFLVSTFALAAMLRATLYDSFEAGWRLDRLFQMIGRDALSFLRIWVMAVVGSIAIAALAMLCTTLLLAAIFGGFTVLLHGVQAVPFQSWGMLIVRHVADLGIGTVLILLLIVIGAAVAYSMLATVCELMVIHAMGVWFSRFDVARWGVSSADLPDGVPARRPAAAVSDQPPERAAAGPSEATGSSPADEPGAPAPGADGGAKDGSVRTPRGDAPYWDDELHR